MCKKLAVVALLVAAGVVALQKFDIQCCRKAKSPEQQIQALEKRLASLDPQRRKLINAIAVEEVVIKNLDEEIAAVEVRLEAKKQRILSLRGDIGAGKDLVKFDTTELTLVEAKKRLAREFEAYRIGREAVASKKKVRDARREVRDAADQQLSDFENSRRALEVELATARAKLTRVRAAQTRSRRHYDTSEFSRIKAGIAQVRNIADVEEKKLEVEARYADAPADKNAQKKTEDVLKEVDDFFKQGNLAEGK